MRQLEDHMENLTGGTPPVRYLPCVVPCKLYFEKCKITRWCPFGIDIISKTGGKVTGIKKMLEHYGITEQEIIAFGDAENDLDMIEFAGIGVAMGNAKDEVKAVADYVTTDVDENGIWNACKYFGLI